jgi:hypothetical protein
MPEGAIYVGRPTKWGNPFRVGEDGRTHDEAVAQHRQWIDEMPADERARFVESARAELGGHDLACWCRPDQGCHADILLRLANP